MDLAIKLVVIGVLILFVIIAAIVVFGLCLYYRDVQEVFSKIDYNGCQDRFKGAKSMYKAGTNVTLYFSTRMIATDTDYKFYLDGERLNGIFVKGKGIKISFVMPSHDVQLTYDAVNSMVTSAKRSE